MWFVKYGDKYLHDPRVSVSITDTSLSTEVNTSGEFKFTITKKHELYDTIREHDMDNEVTVYNDDELIFCGTIVEIDKDFQLTADVTCQGEMSYLNKSLIPPFSTLSTETGENAPDTMAEFFEWLIEKHNSQVDATRQFVIGRNDGSSIVDGSTYFSNDSYSSTGSVIKESILENYSAYITIEHKDDKRIVNLLKDFDPVNAQVIDFGVNLLDFTDGNVSDEVYTVMIPLGAAMKDTEYDYFDGYSLTEDTTPNSSKQYYNHDTYTQATLKNVGTEDAPVYRFESGVRYFEKVAKYTYTYAAWDSCNPNVTYYYNNKLGEKKNLYYFEYGYQYYETDGYGNYWPTGDRTPNWDKTYYRYDYSSVSDLQHFSRWEDGDRSGYDYYTRKASEFYIATSDSNPVHGKTYYTSPSSVSYTACDMPLLKFDPLKSYFEYDGHADESNSKLTLSAGQFETRLEDGYIKTGDKIVATDAVKKYGLMVTTYENTDITTREDLEKYGLIALKSTVSPVRSIEIKAIDLAMIKPDYESIKIGQYVRARSKPHDLDSYFLCSKIDYDLNNPDNNTFTLGTTFDTLTGQQNKRIKSLNATINSVYEASAKISDDAKANAIIAGQAQEKIDEAQSKADEAQSKADEATSKAEEAGTKADNAQASADEANTKSDDAVKKAEEAAANVEVVKKTVATVEANSAEAIKNANAAKEAADNAISEAGKATSTANEANSKAAEANDTANAAKEDAANASAIANTAKEIADGAKTAADEVRADAEAGIAASNAAAEKAQKAANAAKQAADAAQADANTNAKAIGVAQAAADAAKQAAADAQEKAENVESNLDSTNATVEQHSTQLGELTTKVSNATTNADAALSASTEAKQTATEASTTATTAYNDAQTAITNSTKATQTATSAKTTAESAVTTANDSLKQASSAVQTANKIQNTLTTDYQTKADSDLLYATKSSLTETSDSIKMEVSQTYATKSTVEALQNVADNAIESWRGSGVPTAENKPASDWTTDAEKKRHSGDLYYDKDTGKAYRWGSDDGTVYSWVLNQDTDITKALQDASNAQKSANAAQSTADTAKSNAATAQSTADSAKSDAATAKTAADNAQNSADAAQGEVDQLKIDIPNTYATKASLETTAESITGQVESVSKTANSAVTAASKAQQTADAINVDLTKNYQTKAAADNIYATQTSLSATAESISANVTKAQQTADGAVNAASKAQQTADAVTLDLSKNYQTTKDADTKYATQTSLSATAEGLSTDITKAQTTANSAVTAANKAQSTADGIQLDLTKNYYTSSQTDSKIDDISIGGRNLMLGSDKWKSVYTEAVGITATIEDGVLKVVAINDNDNWLRCDCENVIEANLNEGDPFTFSIEIKSEDGSALPTIYFKPGMDYYTMTGSVSSEYSWVYYTGEWKKTNGIVFHLGFGAAIGTYYIRKIKFEKGNKPTDWTPAPEDMADKVYTQAQIKASADSITSTVAKSYATKTELEAANSAVDDLKNTVETSYSTKSEVEQLSDQISSTVTEVTTVKNDLSAAKKTASDAATAASNAKKAADAAQSAADSAQSTADTAKTNAATAQAKADEAANNLATAEANLANLQKQANATDEDLAAAQTAVANAKKAADAAQSAADSAKTAASNAQSTANTAKTNAATAQSTADEAQTAASKAQSDVDALKNRVTTAETNISQNADAIALRATKTEVATAIDNVQIGGRNLLLNTNTDELDSFVFSQNSAATASFVQDEDKGVTAVKVSVSKVPTGYFHFGIPLTDNAKSMIVENKGKQTTVGFDFYNPGESGEIVVFVSNSDGNSALLRLTNVTVDANGWTHVTVTGDIPTTATVSNQRLYVNMFKLPANATAPTAYRLCNFKLELGNKATDWTPAPEDVESDAQTKADDALASAKTYTDAQIKVSSDSITSTVSKTYATQSSLNNYTKKSYLLAQGNGNTAKYMQICMFKVIAAYANLPITITLGDRSMIPSRLIVNFYSYNGTDPTIDSFYRDGDSVAYMVKLDTGTWGLYVEKSSSYALIDVSGYVNPMETRVQVTWTGVNTAELPDGNTIEATKLIGTELSDAYTTQTQFTQTSDEIRMDFNQSITSVSNDLQSRIADSNTSTNEKFAEINKYIRFVDGKIVLGETGNELVLTIQNDRVSFTQAGVEVAYFSDNNLYIKRAEVLTTLKVGNYQFSPRNDGGLALRKRSV